jgi:hypothetical protein
MVVDGHSAGMIFTTRKRQRPRTEGARTSGVTCLIVVVPAMERRELPHRLSRQHGIAELVPQGGLLRRRCRRRFLFFDGVDKKSDHGSCKDEAERDDSGRREDKAEASAAIQDGDR